MSWLFHIQYVKVLLNLKVSGEGVLHCALLGLGGYEFEVLLGLVSSVSLSHS